MAKRKSILCFGDSNTNGYRPDNGGRWGYDERWPGIMQTILGPGYLVIEEGLGGRTTVFDDPFSPERNGVKAVYSVMETHYPVDLVIVMLGTNDCKNSYPGTPATIAYGAGKVVEEIKNFLYPEWCQKPEILMVSPIHIGADTAKSGCPTFDSSSHEKSLHLAEYYEKEAEKQGVHFMDAALYAEPGYDNIHMDAAGHRSLAAAIAEKVRLILG